VNVAPGATFEAFSPELASGLVGTVGVRIRDSAGADFLARTTTSIAADVTVGATSIYRRSLTAPTTAGQYWLVWDDTTTVADPQELVVTSSAALSVTGSLYVTRDEVKTAASLSSLDYADADIDRACDAVSRALDEVCRGKGSHFYQATETRYYSPDDCYGYTYYGEHRLEIDDCAAVSEFAVDTGGDGTYETTWTEGTDFFLNPANADTAGWPFEEILIRRTGGRYFPDVQRAIKITGTFGWPSVPVQVNQYALIYATQMVIRTRQAPLGILTASLESGGGVRISRFDPDFDRLLGQFVRTKLWI
jgi:hypothetical protein